MVAGCGGGGAPRFGMPDPATRAEHSTLHLWQGVFITAMVVGALVWGLIIWSILRYRKKPGDEELPVQTRYHLPLEITYTVDPHHHRRRHLLLRRPGGEPGGSNRERS